MCANYIPNTCVICGKSYLAQRYDSQYCSLACSSRSQRRTDQITDGDIARFWSKIDRSGGLDACWPWVAGRFDSGYGQFWMGHKNIGAHRFAFYLEHGHFPEPFTLHSCDNPPCCNARHLSEGDVVQNAHDMVERGRAARHGFPGESNLRALVTENQVREIRALYAAGGITLKEIGHRFGIAEPTAGGIVNRRTWRHTE
jgi:hypothetical protein